MRVCIKVTVLSLIRDLEWRDMRTGLCGIAEIHQSVDC